MKTRFLPTLQWAILPIVLLLFAVAATAQTKISGMVSDKESGEPLIGVNISVKGKLTGTITDFDGKYELNTSVAPPFTLVFSYTGFASQEVNVTGGQTTVDVKMDAQS
ncbi:MAG TPA: carboxypeptidase-like regulatory domain-containing protein, partial [Saprospiraceae bacterium]|nr:carboxypeptidase-like regulatory domain-containing protein [Saprospiraceae bacterium]